MLRNVQTLTRLFFCLAPILLSIGCASPVAKPMDIDKRKAQHERRMQQEMAREVAKNNKSLLSPPKSDDSYKRQLDRVTTRLNQALKPFCNRSHCYYPVSLVNGDEVNAYADGRTIKVHRGMMRFIKNDDELAIVLAHEITHNLMGHIPKKQMNAGIGLLLDVLSTAGGVDTQGAFSKIGVNAHSPEFENEADYIGLYIMAVAGYNIDKAPYFWRRMGAHAPASIHDTFVDSHPSSPERFVKMKHTIEEIRVKQTKNLSLIPEYKD